MKKWISVLGLLTLAACAPAGGGDSGNRASTSCFAGITTHAIAKDAGPSDDPFSTSKLQLSENETASGAVLAASAKTLAAGTSLTVSIHERCENPGTISKDILSREKSKTSTQSELRAYTWRLPRAMTVTELAVEADADPCVHGISESSVATVDSLPSDPLASGQAHLKSLGLGDVPTLPSGTKPVVIAVIDTGIDLEHEDLRGALWRNSKEIPRNGIDDDDNGYVDDVYGYNFASDISSPAHEGTWIGYFHGTHVAGLAAAEGGNRIGVSGVMGAHAQIMALNVFGSSPGALAANIANAIRYAADNGADVINLSLGGVGKNAAYESALAYALRKGATVFAAAGNSGEAINGGSNFLAPAGYARQFAGMISVGSVDTIDSSLSTFSNFSSSFVEIAAPGAENSKRSIGLLSTFPDDDYERLQGTSMASPVTAGSAALAIAMLRSRGYSPSPATVEAILELSAKTNPNLNNVIRDGRILNLAQMSALIQNSYPATQQGGDPGVPGYNICTVGVN